MPLVLALTLLLWQGAAPVTPPATLSPAAAAAIAGSLEASRAHKQNVWRDTRPINPDGTVTAYVEIPRGDRRKWEFSIPHNRRLVDRVMPRELGGYPVNYGFVPQTVSYDGDPFDALVLGRPLRGGALIRGVVVGILHMEDEKGPDSKVVLSPQIMGKTVYAFTDADRARIAEFFRRHRDHEPGKFTKVMGWGSAEEGLAYVRQTHAFFTDARSR